MPTLSNFRYVDNTLVATVTEVDVDLRTITSTPSLALADMRPLTPDLLALLLTLLNGEHQ